MGQNGPKSQNYVKILFKNWGHDIKNDKNHQKLSFLTVFIDFDIQHVYISNCFYNGTGPYNSTIIPDSPVEYLRKYN